MSVETSSAKMFYLLTFLCRDGEEWHRNRKPISKFIMMPRKMAEYYKPFNDVASDYVDLIRVQRQEDNLLRDLTLSLNKWSMECE